MTEEERKWNFDDYNWLDNYIGDVMFRDAADKARPLAQYPDMEDEYQPTLNTFPCMFEDEGFSVEVQQMADTVWIVCARIE